MNTPKPPVKPNPEPQVKPKPATPTKTETKAKPKAQQPWKVIVLDDPVNTMSYVVLTFRQIFGFDKETAHKHMLQVHETGRSILWSGARERAEHYHCQLQKAHLTAILEQESE